MWAATEFIVVNITVWRLAVGNYTELLATRARNELLKYYRMYLEYSTKVPKYIKVS